MKGSLRNILFILTFIGLTSVTSAQLKIGYILSERIRTEYEEFKEAESQLQLEYRKVQFEFDQMVVKMDSLKRIELKYPASCLGSHQIHVLTQSSPIIHTIK